MFKSIKEGLGNRVHELIAQSAVTLQVSGLIHALIGCVPDRARLALHQAVTIRVPSVWSTQPWPMGSPGTLHA
jgi:hypothetical protein